MSGYTEGVGIRRPASIRHYSANVDLLPTEEYPNLLRDYIMHVWTNLPLAEFIAEAEPAYTCVFNWLMPIPEPPLPEGESYEVNP